MRIGFCYNVKHQDREGLTSETEFDLPETLDEIAHTIEDLGHSVKRIEVTQNIFNQLSQEKTEIDLVFNIAEGLWGDARESWVPLACEMYRIPYTHSSPSVLALCLDKYLAKLAVSGLGIRVPRSVLISGTDIPTSGIGFPLIIKPNAEGSSMGVFDANVIRDQASLVQRVAKLRADGLTSVLLLEEFIDGREFTVGLLGNSPPQVLPIIEQSFDFLPPGMNKIAGYELKWLVEDSLADLSQAYTCPADLTDAQTREISSVSQTIFSGLNVRDCARIDYRMDASGNLYFLEINPIPGINPSLKVISYFPTASRHAGLRFSQVIDTIISQAAARFHLT